MKFLLSLSLVLAFISRPISAQRRPSAPLNIPLQLSGAFCDLRANHFHAGIDFRTQGVEGHTVLAVLDGYISKISVSPWGYGNAVYITHPKDSLISVYGHIQRFTPRVAEKVRAWQYLNESFSVTLEFEAGALPVKRGEVFAYSGNTGSSGGPHLHLELRDLNNNDILDPLAFFKERIPDRRKPQLLALSLHPVQGKGLVNGAQTPLTINALTDANGNAHIDSALVAWGDVGIAFRAVDRMDGTQFAYGIKFVSLSVDSIEMFRFNASRLAFDEANDYNCLIDYDTWRESGAFFFKTFTEPLINMRCIASRNHGIISLNEEKNYNVKLQLSDIYGNTNTAKFVLRGKKQDIAPVDTVGAVMLSRYKANVLIDSGIYLSFPDSGLYNNLLLRYSQTPSNTYYSAVHRLHSNVVTFRKAAKLSIQVDKDITSIAAQKLGIVSINRRGSGRLSWLGGEFNNRQLSASISQTGIYAVSIDTIAPEIKPVEQAKWISERKLSFRITDNLSGIASFRGEIDNKYALFEYDAKKSLITYKFDDMRLAPHGKHHLNLVVTDNCGNLARFHYYFYY